MAAIRAEAGRQPRRLPDKRQIRNDRKSEEQREAGEIALSHYEERNQYQGKVLVGKVNLFENASIPVDPAVSAIPTVVFFNKGKEIKRFVGLQQKVTLKEIIEENLEG